MNRFFRHKIISVATLWSLALLATLALPVKGFAQPKSPERWLLIFDLSPAMKKRLPATEEVLQTFFETSAEGRLQEGDNIGVWTYDQKVHGGQFPLAIWNPKQATVLTSNLTTFLRSRSYTGNSQIAALQPSLSGVVTNSERLTIIIFCDGESEIRATPYDRGINQSFLDGRVERKNVQQPFVVLIRSLSGKYIGCTVNFPPGAINIPLFLAPPPAFIPVPPLVAAPVKPAPVTVPDLIIVGTKVSGPPLAPAPMPPPVVNHPIHPPASPSSEVPPLPVMAPETNPVVKAVARVEIPNIPTQRADVATGPTSIVTVPVIAPLTNTEIAAATSNADGRTRLLVFAGGGLLAAAIVLATILIIRPGRRTQSSLITSLMQDDPRRK